MPRSPLPQAPEGRRPQFDSEFDNREPWKNDESIFEPTEPIVDVRIEGNTTIPAASIAKLVKTRSGRVPTPGQVRDDVKALYKTSWFFSVQPIYRQTTEGLVLIFRVTERPILKTVTYQGNKKIKTKNLENLTGLKPGGAFNVSVNREATRRIEQHYHEKGYNFAKVELKRGDLEEDRDVVFEIDEGAKVYVASIKLEGNEFFGTALLKTKLKSKTRKIPYFGGTYDPANIADDVFSLREYYQGLGFFDVQIENKVAFSEDKAKAQLEYKITEGMRYKIRNVEIDGERVISEETLRKDLEINGGQFFSAAKLSKDVDKIRDRYGALGRIFADIKAVPRFLEEPGQVDLVYNIDEDRVYRIRKIDVVINGEYPHTKETVVLNQCLFSPGDLANPKLIQKTQRRLGGSGYFSNNQMDGTAPKSALKKVENAVIAAPDNGIIRAQNFPAFDSPKRVTRRAADPEPAIPVDNVFDEALREVLWQERMPEIAPREPFQDRRSSSIRQPQTHAARDVVRAQSLPNEQPPATSPLFNNDPQGDPFGNALRDPPPVDELPGFLDPRIDVTETQTGRLMLGVGVNSDAGVVGSAVLDDGNFDILRPPTSFRDILNGTAFRGGGQQFRLEAVPGNQVSRYLISWRDPFFMNTNYSLGLSGFYYTRIFNDWNETRSGGRINVGRQFSPFTSGTLALRLEDVEVNNPAVPTPALLTESLGHNLLTTARVGLQHDTRDSTFLATEGHFVEAAYEQAFGDFSYPRFDLEGRQYFNVHERPDGAGRHIIALRGQTSYTGDDTPIFERLFAGGFQSFRGFNFRGVTPRDGKTGIGGQFMAVGSLEYMFPLTADETLRAVAFTDFGTVENGVTLKNFRATAGAGLRITIPAMGPVPIALDLAWPITKQPYDDTRIFSFYVGFLR